MLGVVSPVLCHPAATLAMLGGDTRLGAQIWLGQKDQGWLLGDTQGQGGFFTRWQQRLQELMLKLVAGPPWGQQMPGEGAELHTPASLAHAAKCMKMGEMHENDPA